LAAELARRHVDCVLIDGHDAPLGWDRATILHARSIEIFEALGLADLILNQGVKVRGARFRSNGQILGKLDLGLAGGRYGFDLGLSEDATEAVLTGYLEDHGGSVTRATRLVGIREGSDCVVVTMEHDGEQREVESSWIVGCDGFHSTTRGLAGIEFPGTDLEAPWAVFDATLQGWDDDHDMIYPFFDFPPVILSPLPGRRWRVYLRPASEGSDLVSDAAETVHRYAPSVEFAAIEHPQPLRLPLARGSQLPTRSGVLGGRRRALVFAVGGARDEHRSPRCVQPGLEARPRMAGYGRVSSA
jgi:2-polyprenyl-6-methoxyphenol hydroxylase-like FAD-dependent oxidoreductase